MDPGLVKLSDAAKAFGVSVDTLRRRIERGTLGCVRSDTNRMFVRAADLPGSSISTDDVRVALYARESSSQNKAALNSQLAVLRSYAAAKGWTVTHVVEEVASGMNDNRPKLHRLLEGGGFDVLLVEHKDRLTRFGFRWFEALAPFRIEVVNVAEDKTTDLMEDLVAIVTSFSARLYGQRRGRIKSKAAVAALVE